MTFDQIVEGVFDKEGRVYAEPPHIDQPTAPGGLTLPVLSAYLGRQASLVELRALTVATARPVVAWQLQRYLAQTGMAAIAFEPLRLQLLDFGYNSGAALAIRWLQRVLRVPRTSVLDAPTMAAIAAADPFLVHQALIGARCQMVFGATRPGGSIEHTFEDGLEARTLSFSLLEVP